MSARDGGGGFSGSIPIEVGCRQEWKSGEIEKMCLYKFTHIPLLKNNALLKQKKKKSDKNKSNHPNLLGNKNHF